MRPLLIALAIAVVLASLIVWPGVDLLVSGWFYEAGKGFYLRDAFLFDILHLIAYAGARILALALLALVIITATQHKTILGLDTKAWLFLFVGLLLGPALVANVVFKDHWGRARPREIAEFGGYRHYTPALLPTHECRHNCSFVAGDGAFGFYLPAFAYVVPRRRARRFFWGGMAAGVLFSFARLATGAHFLSDILFAAFFTQGVIALLYMGMYGRMALRRCWREWLFFPEKQDI